MLLLGIDLGTSSIKASVVDSQTQKTIASATWPETEAEIISKQPGWAEQDPDIWWADVQSAILKCHKNSNYNPKDIAAIGIAYQMHGLVLVDENQHVLRHAIIWCDSRAVPFGDRAFAEIGEEKSLANLLNSPGNFTASKLAWVKHNEPGVYSKADKLLLPGDFIALRLTGEANTTISALSEGVLWDFTKDEVSQDVLQHFGFDKNIVPPVQPLFSNHGLLLPAIAEKLGLTAGIPVSYKAGDQPNNALSLNVMQPGEIATTAGTSGVIYGVSDHLFYDKNSRINSFAHVNYDPADKRIGVLLCINGVGIFNKWIKNIAGVNTGYNEVNKLASEIPPGSQGLLSFPFGNGAERIFNNKIIGAHFNNLDLNIHNQGHMFRAVQEGIAYSFRYGMDIMRENGMNPTIVRANKANMFQSDLFTQAFADLNNVMVEFYEGDGSYGAAIGAGIGAQAFANTSEAFANRKAIGSVSPNTETPYHELYEQWKQLLSKYI